MNSKITAGFNEAWRTTGKKNQHKNAAEGLHSKVIILVSVLYQQLQSLKGQTVIKPKTTIIKTRYMGQKQQRTLNVSTASDF